MRSQKLCHHVEIGLASALLLVNLPGVTLLLHTQKQPANQVTSTPPSLLTLAPQGSGGFERLQHED